jgi:four helix bundle protein
MVRDVKRRAEDKDRKTSTRPVCANIAEAWRTPGYPAAFISELSDADAAAGESLVWIDIARECGCLTPGEAKRLSESCDRVGARLMTMMNQSETWRI